MFLVIVVVAYTESETLHDRILLSPYPLWQIRTTSNAVPDALAAALAAPEPSAWAIGLLFLHGEFESFGLEASDPGELGVFERHFWWQHPFKVAVAVGQMTQQIPLSYSESELLTWLNRLHLQFYQQLAIKAS